VKLVRSALAVVTAIAVLPSAAVAQGRTLGTRPEEATPTEPPAGEASTDPMAGASEAPQDTTTPTEPGDSPPVDPMLEALIAEATRHFKEGRRMFFDGDYAAAAAEFERSYAAIQSGDALRNVVLSHARAGAPLAAIRAARRYLELEDCGTPGADPIHCAREREDIAATERRLLRQVGELGVVVEPDVPVREIRVGGRVVPLEDFPLILEPGPVEIVVRGPQPEDELVRIVRMRAGEQETFVVRGFEPPPVVERPPDDRAGGVVGRDPALAERRQRALRLSAWAGLGLTVAAGAATGVLGGLSLRAKNRFETEQDDISDGQGPPEHVARRFYRLRDATNAMIAVTAVVGTATVLLMLFAFVPEPSANARTGTGRAALTRLGASPGGISIRF
jgi:hypothetical protein